MNKPRVLFLFVIIVYLFTFGCGGDQAYGDVNGWEFKRMTIPVGTNPPPPGEAGVVGTESRGRDVITGHDLASFGERWNEAVGGLDIPGLSLDEVNITYQKPVLTLDHDIEDWLMVYAAVCYDTGYLESTAVEWEIVPDIIGEHVSGSWAALIYATIPNITVGESFDVIDELGIMELSADEMADFELQKVIGDYRYHFYSVDTWGDFEITPIQ